jgi:flagellar biogenesis protein FliO
LLVVQSFEKVPSLKAMAPTQSEPPFLVAQLVVLALFIVLTIFAVKKFHPEAGRTP